MQLEDQIEEKLTGPAQRYREVADILRRLQLDVEYSGSEALRERRRLLLRGIRVGLCAADRGTPINEITAVLREELFGSGARK